MNGTLNKDVVDARALLTNTAQKTYQIAGLQMTFGRGAKAFTAIHNLDLTIQPGELLVLLGPSGCGKTTALRCVAGLESATNGRISFGDRVVFDAERGIDVPPDKRDVGMCFQSYALWPHKTVRQNIAYPLKARRMSSALKGENWVEAAADLVDVGHLLDRFPGQLSGGQQQRVALARAIVARPDLVLFDEPLSNLDALLRSQVRNELHELHQRLGFSGVYVTHDQSEAFAIGDRLAVMREGVVEQIGTPDAIYSRPESEYAANFVGMVNRLTLTRDAGGWNLAGDGTTDKVELAVEPQTNVTSLRFRPSAAKVVGSASALEGFRFRARVNDSVYAGGRYEVSLSRGDAQIGAMAEMDIARRLRQGDEVDVVVPWANCAWYDADGRWAEVPRRQSTPV